MLIKYKKHTNEKEENWIMFCEKCGTELKEGAMFCQGCGTKVTQQSVPVEPVQPVQPEWQQPAQPVICLQRAHKYRKMDTHHPARLCGGDIQMS